MVIVRKFHAKQSTNVVRWPYRQREQDDRADKYYIYMHLYTLTIHLHAES